MSIEETAESSAVPGSEAAKPRAPRPRGYVTLVGTWCKGCGICIEFCPMDVLEANGNGRPIVAHPERCSACHWCDTHCPDMAITVRRLEPEEVAELEELTAQIARAGQNPGGTP